MSAIRCAGIGLEVAATFYGVLNQHQDKEAEQIRLKDFGSLPTRQYAFFLFDDEEQALGACKSWFVGQDRVVVEARIVRGATYHRTDAASLEGRLETWSENAANYGKMSANPRPEIILDGIGSKPMSIARAFVLFAILTLNLGVALGRDDVSKTYRCTAKDAVSLQNNGTVDRDSIAKTHRKNLDGIIINTLTGAITYASGSRDIWRVVQEGNSANDHVLIPRIFFQEANKAAATAATDFIRVRAWSSQPQVTFMAFSLSILVTGTCEIAQ